jgi:hypothetical protein
MSVARANIHNVIPAKAGIQESRAPWFGLWIPAFAGMTPWLTEV